MSNEITMGYVGGIKIGLVGLSDIFEELKSTGLNNEKEIKNFLLEKGKSPVTDERVEMIVQQGGKILA